MKYTLIATIVVLALAQGTLSKEVPEIEKLTQFFEGMKTELMSTVEKMTEALQSQTFIQDGTTHIEPIVTQIKDNLAPLAASVQEKISPLAEDMQKRIKPVMDDFQTQMETMFRQLMEQAQAQVAG